MGRRRNGQGETFGDRIAEPMPRGVEIQKRISRRVASNMPIQTDAQSMHQDSIISQGIAERIFVVMMLHKDESWSAKRVEEVWKGYRDVFPCQ